MIDFYNFRFQRLQNYRFLQFQAAICLLRQQQRTNYISN